jgi:hypothetical protein
MARKMQNIKHQTSIRSISMRTTLSIDDDVMLAAKHLAGRQHKTIGEVLSTLARQSLHAGLASRTGATQRNGIPLLVCTASTTPVTLDLVNQLRDELS